MKCKDCNFWNKNPRHPSPEGEIVLKNMKCCSFLKTAEAIDIIVEINGKYDCDDIEVVTSPEFGCIFFKTKDCECGNIATHEIRKKGKCTYLCYSCYVKAGNPPADRHDDCTKVYRKMMSLLDEKYVNFKKWLDSIADKKGLDSVLTISQIYKMLHYLDGAELRIDNIILAAFDKDK